MIAPHRIHGTDYALCVKHGKRVKVGEACPVCPSPSKPAPPDHPGLAKVRPPKRGAMAEIAMRKILNDLDYVAIEDANQHVNAARIYVAEFTFAPHERNWRCDFALPVARLAIEIDGGAHAAGKSKQRTDTEKRGELAARGYRVVAVTPEEVRDGTARDRVARALNQSARAEGGS